MVPWSSLLCKIADNRKIEGRGSDDGQRSAYECEWNRVLYFLIIARYNAVGSVWWRETVSLSLNGLVGHDW